MAFQPNAIENLRVLRFYLIDLTIKRFLSAFNTMQRNFFYKKYTGLCNDIINLDYYNMNVFFVETNI